jgi:hypothetical protein
LSLGATHAPSFLSRLITRAELVAYMNSVVIVETCGLGFYRIWILVDNRFYFLIASASLRCFQGFDTWCLHNLFLRALRSSERVVIRLSLSRALQVITLLPGIAFALIVAFLAIAVALDARLVGSPFRLRLRSFIRVILRTFIIIGTWFAFSSIELHLL